MDNNLLYKYFMRHTTAAEDRDVRQWVEASEENRARFMAERRFFDLASMYDEVEEPVAERPGIFSRVVRPILRYGAAAAAAALAVVAYHAYTADETAKAPAKLQAMEIPAGQRLRVELSDGTAVWLNSNTRIELAGDFSGDSRTVSIDGEAYFEVAKDAKHPFVVNTPRGSVTVTGTTFNVDAYSSSESMVVSLVEGSVDVSYGNDVHSLTPGRRIVLENGRYSYDDICTEDLAWIDGIVSFYQLPLKDILFRFEKYYGVKVSYLSREMPDSRFSGKFYIDEGIEQALKALQRDMNFIYEIDKDSRNVTIR